jgi:hypothetical protein
MNLSAASLIFNLKSNFSLFKLGIKSICVGRFFFCVWIGGEEEGWETTQAVGIKSIYLCKK